MKTSSFCLVLSLTTFVVLPCRSETHETTTTPHLQPAPQNFTVSNKRSESVTLTWRAPESWFGKALGYEITTMGGAEDEIDNAVRIEKDTFLYRPSFLTPKTEYNFSLVAICEWNHNEMTSDPVTLTTETLDFDEPSPPLNFRLASQNSKVMKLAWDQPRKWNSQEGGFVISYIDQTGLKRSVKLEDKTYTNFPPDGLKLGDWYEFNLTAYNRMNNTEKISQQVQLHVQAKPDHPINFQVKIVSPFSINITWDKPLDEDVNGYVVRYHTSTDREGEVWVTGQDFGLVGLTPWTLCSFNVTAYIQVDKKRIESQEVQLSAHTNFTEPSGSLNLTVDFTQEPISIVWSPPPTANGPLSGYRIRLVSENITFDAITIDHNYTFKDVPVWTPINISVSAFNHEGDIGPFYGPEDMLNLQVPGAPGMMEPPTVIGHHATYFYINWTDPEEKNGPVNGFDLDFSYGNGTAIKTMLIYGHLVIIDDLEPWTEYHLSIHAYNSFFETVYNGPDVNVTMWTYVGAPSAPTDVKEGQVTNTSIEVTWKEPKILNGPLSGYVVQCSGPDQVFTVIQPYANYTFTKLLPSTEYNITVNAFNQVYPPERVDGLEYKLTSKTSDAAPPIPNGELQVSRTNQDTATLKVPLDLFSNQDGDIVEFILWVTANNSGPMPRSGYETLNETGFPTWHDYDQTGNWFRASPMNWFIQNDTRMCDKGDDKSKDCVIGLVKNCEADLIYCGGPLKSKTKHWAKIRGYTRNGWAESLPVSFETVESSAGKLVSRLAALITVIMLIFNC